MSWINNAQNLRQLLYFKKRWLPHLNTICSAIGCFNQFKATEPYQEICPICRQKK